jgi:hypothetical protein
MVVHTRQCDGSAPEPSTHQPSGADLGARAAPDVLTSGGFPPQPAFCRLSQKPGSGKAVGLGKTIGVLEYVGPPAVSVKPNNQRGGDREHYNHHDDAGA